jgi:hypothetical protein
MKEVIKETKGKYFSVVFTKKDGSTRRMTARLGVKKGINGKGMSYDPSEKDLMVVWDAQKNDYRMVNLSTIISFKCGSKVINNRLESV